MSGHEVRKQWKNAVMSAYATLTPHVPSKQMPAEVAARRQANERISEIRGSGSEEATTAGPLPSPRKAAAEEPQYRGNLRFQTFTEA